MATDMVQHDWADLQLLTTRRTPAASVQQGCCDIGRQHACGDVSQTGCNVVGVTHKHGWHAMECDVLIPESLAALAAAVANLLLRLSLKL